MRLAGNGAGVHRTKDGAGVHQTEDGAGVHLAEDGAGVRLAEDGTGVHLAEISVVSACASALAGPEFLPVIKCTSFQQGSGK